MSGFFPVNEQRIVGGKYSLLAALGSGAQGIVYKALHLETHKIYAVKEVDTHGMGDEEREAALQEVRLLATLQHPHILQYHDSFVDGTCLYMVMELALGGTLQDVIQQQQQQQSMPTALVWRYFLEVASALHHVHTHRTLHRDVKTANVFICEGGKAKLGDFGVSKVLTSTSCKVKSVIGTPFYLSPEMCHGRPYGPKSDIWALGCLLYELLMRRTAFHADNQAALVLNIIRGRFRSLDASVDPHLAKMCTWCLKMSDGDRPTAKQILLHQWSYPHIITFEIPAPASETSKKVVVRSAAHRHQKEEKSSERTAGVNPSRGTVARGATPAAQQQQQQLQQKTSDNFLVVRNSASASSLNDTSTQDEEGQAILPQHHHRHTNNRVPSRGRIATTRTRKVISGAKTTATITTTATANTNAQLVVAGRQHQPSTATASSSASRRRPSAQSKRRVSTSSSSRKPLPVKKTAPPTNSNNNNNNNNNKSLVPRPDPTFFHANRPASASSSSCCSTSRNSINIMKKKKKSGSAAADVQSVRDLPDMKRDEVSSDEVVEDVEEGEKEVNTARRPPLAPPSVVSSVRTSAGLLPTPNRAGLISVRPGVAVDPTAAALFAVDDDVEIAEDEDDDEVVEDGTTVYVTWKVDDDHGRSDVRVGSPVEIAESFVSRADFFDEHDDDVVICDDGMDDDDADGDNKPCASCPREDDDDDVDDTESHFTRSTTTTAFAFDPETFISSLRDDAANVVEPALFEQVCEVLRSSGGGNSRGDREDLHAQVIALVPDEAVASFLLQLAFRVVFAEAHVNRKK
eukprot:PhM_4_TR2774/c0_g1_i1/m.33246/K08857/NEK1_4_5; NIMA (never in mitosis gene a)-related kinase 1/4/5